MLTRRRVLAAIAVVAMVAGSGHAAPWSNFVQGTFGSNSTYKGSNITVGDIVRVYDAGGTLAGSVTLGGPPDGVLPSFSAAGDDVATPGVDEGGVQDETMSFTIERPGQGEAAAEVTVITYPGGAYTAGLCRWTDTNGDTWVIQLVVPDLLLEFQTQPAASVSGAVLGTQPVVRAMKNSALDVAFTEDVTLSLVGGGPGALSGTVTVAAVGGIATFTNVVYTAAVDGEAFTIQANDEDGAGTDNYGLNSANAINSDVVATALAFTTAPADGGAVNGDIVSGQVFATQPVVTAQGAGGVTDTDYTTVVTLTEGSAGALTGTLTKAAVAGVADFAGQGVTYTATADQEAFTLTGTGGVTGNSAALTADAVATTLVFTTAPADAGAVNGNIVSGQVFATQPQVTARDGDGLTDTDYVTVVTLTEASAGALAGTARAAVAGVVTGFNDIAYTATADQETFTLTATGGVTGTSALLTADAVATTLVFTTAAADAGAVNGDIVSGQVFATQPQVTARDGDGLTDTDYVTVVTLTEASAGALAGTARAAVGGVVVGFNDIAYTATVDQETFVLTATGGVTGVAAALTADVVATQMVFSTQPTGAYNTLDMLTQPVVTAQDAGGLTDIHFTEVVDLTATVVTGGGALSGGVNVAAVAGVATFVTVRYDVTTDGDTFFLTADDQVAGGDLPSVNSNTIAGLILPPPVLTAIPAEVVFYQENQTPLLTWSTVLVAASYELEWGAGTAPACADIVLDASTTPSPLAVAGTQYQMPRVADGSYCWRVRSVGAGGNASPWSPYSTFNTIPTLGEWGLIFLIVTMIGYAGWYLRRRDTVSA